LRSEKQTDSAGVQLPKGMEIDPAIKESLTRTIFASRAEARGRYRVCLDTTLVRGMSYYTGQIFEIEHADYPLSLGCRGRYDAMIGRLTGRDTPACGFSIGFERVVALLEQDRRSLRSGERKIAVLFEPYTNMDEVLAAARKLRTDDTVVSMQTKQSKMARQL